ncbi:MAG TPA: hypothetical protein VMA34_07420 [Terracidiphilus sp.]|nr:hypothetical protein [Terracidiphilus sp.]
MRPLTAFVLRLAVSAAAIAAAQVDLLAEYTRHVWHASDGPPEQTAQALAPTRHR